MTLVVVQQKGSVIAAVSDTGILEHGKQFPPEKQVPKICILTPDLTVAFAGNPDLAKRYLNDFPESANYKTTVDYLLDRHCEANRQVDFLALFNKPVPKIVQIRNGRIYLSMKIAWIGDQAAFEAFQRYRHSHPSASVTSVFEKVLMFSTHETVTHHDNATPQLLDALRYVIMDPRIGSVFGFEVSVHNADGEFRYRDYAITLTEQQFFLAFPTVFLREKAPERDELRNYAASCFINGEDVDVRGLAYHFPHNKVTYVYWGKNGKLLSNTYIVKDKNIEEFMQDAAEEFGREWKGVVALRTQPSPEYGIPVQRWTKVDEPLPQHSKTNVRGECPASA